MKRIGRDRKRRAVEKQTKSARKKTATKRQTRHDDCKEDTTKTGEKQKQEKKTANNAAHGRRDTTTHCKDETTHNAKPKLGNEMKRQVVKKQTKIAKKKKHENLPQGKHNEDRKEAQTQKPTVRKRKRRLQRRRNTKRRLQGRN